MTWLRDLFASGRIIDAVLALTVAEAAALIAYHRATGGGVAARDFLLNLVSGLCLMLALRAALGGWGWTSIAGCLLASLAAHLADLRARWKRRPLVRDDAEPPREPARQRKV